MKHTFAALFLATVSIFLLSACSNKNALEYLPTSTEYAAPTQTPLTDNSDATTAPHLAEPTLPTEPIQLTVQGIPAGVYPVNFLHDLGYDAFDKHELLRWEARWASADWLVLQTNTTIQDFRVITLIPHYEAYFDNGWQFTRHYAYEWTQFTTDLLPDKPLVWWWHADERSLTESGLSGVAFVDADGHERFFRVQQDGDTIHLVPFENIPGATNNPMITILRPSPEIELIAAWFIDYHRNGYTMDKNALAARNHFLQAFETYTVFDNPLDTWGFWVTFGANTDLQGFQFFNLGHVCDPWVNEGWHYFYVDTVLGTQAVLPFGEPVAIPWRPSGTWPTAGISFLDENNQRRNFTLNSNEGSGFPPMFITEFVDRVYCENCENHVP